MLIANDIHGGVKRSAGVTPTSMEALRTYLYSSFRDLLRTTTEKHLLIDGDLLDQFEIDTRDWLEVYAILKEWLEGGKTLTLKAGNHDDSRKGSKVSSFHALCEVLSSSFEGHVQVIGIDQWDEVWSDGSNRVYALAHCSNSDIFDLKLKGVLAVAEAGDWLLLHANYSNPHAAASQHSLNLTEEQAREFIDKGVSIGLSHEHQARREIPQGSRQTGAEVVVFGNQFCTSISDCLGNDCKHAHVLRDGVLTKVKTWDSKGVNGFAQVNWRDLADYEGDAGFIRVCGEAKAHEAAAALNVIAKFRQKSDAFVISSAVQVEGVAVGEDTAKSIEQAKSFDVMEFIRSEVTAEEYKKVEMLMEKANA